MRLSFVVYRFCLFICKAFSISVVHTGLLLMTKKTAPTMQMDA